MTITISAGASSFGAAGEPASNPVLIVDDDDSIRETMAEYLDLEGYVVLSAANGAAALAIIAEHRLSLLITDLSMPDMDGIALIRAAREHDPKLPAILLTGFSEQASARATGGNYHVLRKPVQMTQLLQQMTLSLSTEI